MITAFDIWAITRLDGIRDLLMLCSILFGLITCVGSVISVTYYMDNRVDKMLTFGVKVVKTSAIIFVCCSTTFVLLPNMKTAAAMVIVPKVVNSEFVQEIPAYAKAILDKALGVDLTGLIQEAKSGALS